MLSRLQQGVVVVASAVSNNGQAITVLDRNIVLLLRNAHHDQVTWYSYLRPGLDRRAYSTTHVRCLIIERIGRVAANNRVIVKVWWLLSAHCHASSLLP